MAEKIYRREVQKKNKEMVQATKMSRQKKKKKEEQSVTEVTQKIWRDTERKQVSRYPTELDQKRL